MKHFIFPLFLLLSTSMILATQAPRNHDLTTENHEFFDEQVPFRKPKGYLSVDYLNVTTALTVSGQQIIGTTTQSGAGFAASYGQLSLNSEQVIFNAINTDVAIPFDTAGPSSNLTISTEDPATITIQNDGLYQINISIYLSSENSHEDTFDPTTYTVFLYVNRTATACSDVYAGQAGTFSLNYSALKSLSAHDEVQFYISTSALGEGSEFRNIVYLYNSSANVVQIAD